MRGRAPTPAAAELGLVRRKLSSKRQPCGLAATSPHLLPTSAGSMVHGIVAVGAWVAEKAGSRATVRPLEKPAHPPAIHAPPPEAFLVSSEINENSGVGKGTGDRKHGSKKKSKSMVQIFLEHQHREKDLNYDRLQLVQEKCNSLEHQHREKDGIINYFSNHWCSSLDGDRMAAKELYRIIDTNFIARSTSKDNDLNHILSQVRYVADHLNDTTTQSEYDLQRTNEYYWSLDDDIEGISALGNESHQSQPL